MERIDVLAAMKGQRVVLPLAAAAAVKGVLFAVDPWSKSVLLLLEPEQRQQRVPACLPPCIYVEGRQIKSWRSGDEYAGGAAAFGSGDGVPEGAGCFRRALPCEQRMVLPMRTCAWCSSFRWPGWQSACRCWCCGCGPCGTGVKHTHARISARSLTLQSHLLGLGATAGC